MPFVIGSSPTSSALGEVKHPTAVRASVQQLNNLIKYINNVGDARDGKHEAIDGWMWWSWNANSGDTGGIVSRFAEFHMNDFA